MITSNAKINRRDSRRLIVFYDAGDISSFSFFLGGRMRKTPKVISLVKNFCKIVYAEFAHSIFEPTETGAGRFNYSFNASMLVEIELFIEAIFANEKCDYSTLARYFQDIHFLFSSVQALSKNYDYNEHIQLFIDGCQSLNSKDQFYLFQCSSDPSLSYEQLTGIKANIFNTLVKNIQRKWKQKHIREKTYSRRIVSKKRFLEYQSYVEKLFRDHQCLRVLQVDFYYQKQHFDAIQIQQAQKDFDALFNNRRANKIFDSMLGYIARIGYTIELGNHLSVIYFFKDGFDLNHGYSPANHAQQIGEHWIETITKGRGAYVNYHKPPKTLRLISRILIPEIEVIDSLDPQCHDSMIKLDHIICYLCLMDQFLKPNVATPLRLIRRGISRRTPKRKSQPSRQTQTEPQTES